MASFFRRAAKLVSNTIKLKPSRIYVGEDLQGNKYYKIPPQKYFLGLSQQLKEARLVIPPGGEINTSQYDPITVTKEWDSWLRKRRNDPPELEELVSNLEKQSKLQQRIQLLSQKETLAKSAPESIKSDDTKGKEEQTVETWSSNKS